jgi:hypothetical protein
LSNTGFYNTAFLVSLFTSDKDQQMEIIKSALMYEYDNKAHLPLCLVKVIFITECASVILIQTYVCAFLLYHILHGSHHTKW